MKKKTDSVPDVDAIVARHEETLKRRAEEERARRKAERDARNARVRKDHADVFVKVRDLEARGMKLLALPGWRQNPEAIAALDKIREQHKALVDGVEGVGLVLYDETITAMNEVAEGDQHAFARAVNLAVLRGNLVTGTSLTDEIRKKGSLVWVGRDAFGWPGEPRALIAATMNARRRALPRITPAEALEGKPGRCEFNAVQEFPSGPVEARVVIEVWWGEFNVPSAGDLTGFLRNPEKGPARIRHLLKEATGRTVADDIQEGLVIPAGHRHSPPSPSDVELERVQEKPSKASPKKSRSQRKGEEEPRKKKTRRSRPDVTDDTETFVEVDAEPVVKTEPASETDLSQHTNVSSLPAEALMRLEELKRQLEAGE